MKVHSVEEYINSLPEDRKIVIQNIRQVILKNLPEGFQETISYGMIGYVVPHSIYPKGYHCNPKEPLPFISIASQKGHIAIYHLGLYADQSLKQWFTNELSQHSKSKLDIGKSCIRFKKINEIPYDLIGKLCTKMSVQNWISLYEKAFNKR
ncbi:MAG: hypothetical protein KatS3mg027_1039 [Bacteroidia bacterium]|nr:MAG: hypothetical protein KatS3mg027_1039 [Bacteroidia bacterium]